MSWVAVAVGGMNALNQMQQGRMAAGAADMQAGQAERQAKVERETALKTAALIRRGGARQVGAATAAYAGAGVKVGEGSAGEVERQITQDYEHDAFQAILDGDRRGRGLETDATLTRIDGSMRQTAGMVSAAGTLLSTGYQAYNKWQTLPSKGDGLSQGDRRKIGVF